MWKKESLCQSLSLKTSRPRLRELEYESSSDTEMIIDTITDETLKQDWKTTVKLNDQDVTFKIDTGTQCNVLSKETYNLVCQQPLKKSQAKLVAFGGHRISSLGKAVILCEHKNKYSAVEFEVLSTGP